MISLPMQLDKTDMLNSISDQMPGLFEFGLGHRVKFCGSCPSGGYIRSVYFLGFPMLDGLWLKNQDPNPPDPQVESSQVGFF